MCTIAMLADTAYRQLLIPELHIQDIEILMPIEGLSEGRQLQWLGACLNRPDKSDARTHEQQGPVSGADPGNPDSELLRDSVTPQSAR